MRVSGPSVAEIVAKCFQSDDDTIDVRTLVEPTGIGGHSAFPNPHSPLPIDLFLWPTGAQLYAAAAGGISHVRLTAFAG